MNSLRNNVICEICYIYLKNNNYLLIEILTKIIDFTVTFIETKETTEQKDAFKLKIVTDIAKFQIPKSLIHELQNKIIDIISSLTIECYGLAFCKRVRTKYVETIGNILTHNTSDLFKKYIFSEKRITLNFPKKSWNQSNLHIPIWHLMESGDWDNLRDNYIDPSWEDLIPKWD